MFTLIYIFILLFFDQDIRELYQLAEEIIMGENYVEAPEECEEEAVVEEPEQDISSDHEAQEPAKA